MGSVNGGFIGDDARSHVSGYSVKPGSAGANLLRSRSLIDAQAAHRSVSALSGRGGSYLPPGIHPGGMAGLGHPLSGLHGMGLGHLGMAGLSGSMGAMAGLPTLSGMGLSRAGSRLGCSGKAVKTVETTSDGQQQQQHQQQRQQQQRQSNRRHHSKNKSMTKSGQSASSADRQADKVNKGDPLTTSTTTLIPSESLPASSTETLTSTQA